MEDVGYNEPNKKKRKTTKAHLILINSGPGLVEVVAEVCVDERDIGTAPRLIRITRWASYQTLLGSGSHNSPVVDPISTSGTSLELQFMVLAKAGEVLSHDIIATSLRVLGLLVVTVARCGSSVEGSPGRLIVIYEDNNVFPVVAMTADKVAISRLVLGPVPSVHNGKLAIMHGGTSICLTLTGILTATSLTTAVLEPTTMNKVSHKTNLI